MLNSSRSVERFGPQSRDGRRNCRFSNLNLDLSRIGAEKNVRCGRVHTGDGIASSNPRTLPAADRSLGAPLLSQQPQAFLQARVQAQDAGGPEQQFAVESLASLVAVRHVAIDGIREAEARKRAGRQS